MKSLEEIFGSEVLTSGNVASVRKLIYHLVSGHRDADQEDLVQTVFTNAWGALGKFGAGVPGRLGSCLGSASVCLLQGNPGSGSTFVEFHAAAPG